MKMSFFLFVLFGIFFMPSISAQEEGASENVLQTEEGFFQDSSTPPPSNDSAPSEMNGDILVPESSVEAMDSNANSQPQSEEYTEESYQDEEIDADGNVVDDGGGFYEAPATAPRKQRYPPLTGVHTNLNPVREKELTQPRDLKSAKGYLGTTKKGLDPYRDKKRIRHPLAEKGLYKINKERAYLYKVTPSKQDRFSTIRFGFYEPKNLKNDTTGISFSDVYDSSNNPLLLADYEWNLWRGALGVVTYKLGLGVFVATGNGQFDKNSNNAGLVPPENFTLLAFPLSAGAIYRLEIWDKQFLVPYADGGLSLFGFTEIRDDDTGPKFGGAYTAYGAGGVAINLSGLDRNSMLDLDREHGINDIYFNVEYRVYFPLGGTFDFGGDYISGGVTASF
ncbi:MAG: hypothetical protein KDD61_03395 [Bdellovibrionales bacterium]|nr:hypothetical protein [Bdellovibrionales bacterium]